MWFQQPDAFTLVQFRLECDPDEKTHEVTRCKQPHSVSLWDYGINKFNCNNSFTAIHVIMLELKNNKHNTYYRCTYLYIVNAVIFKLLLASHLKRDLAKKTTTLTLPLYYVLQYPWVQRFCMILLFSILGVWIDRDIICLCELILLAALARGGAVLKHVQSHRESCSPITTHWDS